MQSIKDIFAGLGLVAILVLVAMLYYGEEKPPVPPPSIVVQTDTVIVVDYIDKDPVYIEKKVIVRDTVYVHPEGDTTDTGFAPLDTTFRTGDRLSVIYYIEPRVFDIEFYPAPAESVTTTITNTEYVYIDSSAWWDTFRIGATSGVIATALLTFLVK